jgi:hypothetical protein
MVINNMITDLLIMCKNKNIKVIMTTDRMQYHLAMGNNIPAIYLGIRESSYYLSDSLCDNFLEYIADNVLIVVSKYNLIFDTSFIIFKKIVENDIINDDNSKIYIYNSIPIDDNYELHNKLYNIFQDKFSNQNN